MQLTKSAKNQKNTKQLKGIGAGGAPGPNSPVHESITGGELKQPLILENAKDWSGNMDHDMKKYFDPNKSVYRVGFDHAEE